MTTFVELNQFVRLTEGEDDQMVSVTRPFSVNPRHVRSVRSRTEGPGTRVEFPNSSAVIVTESYEEVMTKFRQHVTTNTLS